MKYPMPARNPRGTAAQTAPTKIDQIIKDDQNIKNHIILMITFPAFEYSFGHPFQNLFEHCEYCAENSTSSLDNLVPGFVSSGNDLSRSLFHFKAF